VKIRPPHININRPSFIELPEGCTGTINDHKIYGHPWNTETQAVKIYNELTPGVDEDEGLLFKLEEEYPRKVQKKSKSAKSYSWYKDIEEFGRDLIKSVYLKLSLGLMAIFAVLYCLCAPMSWPRCNCCIWFTKTLWNMTTQVIRGLRQLM